MNCMKQIFTCDVKSKKLVEDNKEIEYVFNTNNNQSNDVMASEQNNCENCDVDEITPQQNHNGGEPVLEPEEKIKLKEIYDIYQIFTIFRNTSQVNDDDNEEICDLETNLSSSSNIISVDDLKRCMRPFNFFLRSDEFDIILSGVKLDEHKNITFDEFVKLIKNLRSSSNVTETNEIMDTILLFDKQRKGFISMHDVELVVDQLGIDMSQNEVEEMFAEIDYDKDGLITYKDFIDCLYEEENEEKVNNEIESAGQQYFDDEFIDNFPKDSVYWEHFNGVFVK